MRLHREGNTILLLSFLFLLGMGILSYFTMAYLWFIAVIACVTLIFALILQFFRVPHRRISAENHQVVCPADGKIVVIEQVYEPEFIQEICWQISIFMSPLNVHANYYPIDGKVIYTQYHPGKYLVAWHPKSSTENERSTTVIETNEGKKVLVRQIAGAMARRICFYAKKDQTSIRGAELGFIKFGSRVDVFLPLEAKIQVVIGQIVKNRKDILASL